MGKRITSKDVEMAAVNLSLTLKRLGMIPEAAALRVGRGSRGNGVSHSLAYVIMTEPGQGSVGRQERLPAVDLHGALTAREAHARITAANTALNAVERHLRDRGSPAIAG